MTSIDDEIPGNFAIQDLTPFKCQCEVSIHLHGVYHLSCYWGFNQLSDVIHNGIITVKAFLLAFIQVQLWR